MGCASGDLRHKRESQVRNQKNSLLFSLGGCLFEYLGLLLCLQTGRLPLLEALGLVLLCYEGSLAFSIDWVLSYSEMWEGSVVPRGVFEETVSALAAAPEVGKVVRQCTDLLIVTWPISSYPSHAPFPYSMISERPCFGTVVFPMIFLKFEALKIDEECHHHFPRMVPIEEVQHV